MNIKTPSILFCLLIQLTSFASHAKAFCALRDPVAQIYQLYPDADNYRSIVRTVDDNIRQQIIDRLPNHQLHHDELGRHTLYIPLRQGKPIGIVHVRSEQSRWGLVEIAWALDFDLTVVDFTFQRSRALDSKRLSREVFKQQLAGKNFAALSRYISTTDQLADANAQTLSAVVLVNGLKTLLVTELAWSTEISHLKNQ